MKHGDILVEYTMQPSARTITKRKHVIQEIGVHTGYITHGYLNPIVNLLGEDSLKLASAGTILSMCFVETDDEVKNSEMSVKVTNALIQGMGVHNEEVLNEARSTYMGICERLSQPVTLVDKTKWENV